MQFSSGWGWRGHVALLVRSLGTKLRTVCESIALGFLDAAAIRNVGMKAYSEKPNAFPPFRNYHSESGLYSHIDWTAKQVLDLACGQGREAFYLEKRGAKVTAIDNHEMMLEQGRQYAIQSGSTVEFIACDYVYSELPGGDYDVVYLSSGMYGSVLGKGRRQQLLRQMIRVVKKDGLLLLTVRPFRKGNWNWKARHLITCFTALISCNSFKFELGDRFFFWEPCHSFTEQEFFDELASCGLSIKKCVPVYPGNTFILCEVSSEIAAG